MVHDDLGCSNYQHSLLNIAIMMQPAVVPAFYNTSHFQYNWLPQEHLLFSTQNKERPLVSNN